MPTVKLTPDTDFEAEAKRGQAEQANQNNWLAIMRHRFGFKGRTPEEQRKLDVENQNKSAGEKKG